MLCEKKSGTKKHILYYSMYMKVKNRPSEPMTTEIRKDHEGAFRVLRMFYTRIVQKKCSASRPRDFLAAI